MTQTGRAHPERPRSLPQAAREPGLDFAPGFSDLRSVALHIDQPKRRRGLIHIRKHFSEELFVLLPAHAQPSLRHEIPERQRRRQLLRSTQQMRLDLLQQHLQCGVIIER